MWCQLLGKSASEGLRLLMRSPVKNVTHGAACSEERPASTLAVVTLSWGFDLTLLCKRRICLAGEKPLLPCLSLGRSMAMSTCWCTRGLPGSHCVSIQARLQEDFSALGTLL